MHVGTTWLSSESFQTIWDEERRPPLLLWALFHVKQSPASPCEQRDALLGSGSGCGTDGPLSSSRQWCTRALGASALWAVFGWPGGSSLLERHKWVQFPLPLPDSWPDARWGESMWHIWHWAQGSATSYQSQPLIRLDDKNPTNTRPTPSS